MQLKTPPTLLIQTVLQPRTTILAFPFMIHVLPTQHSKQTLFLSPVILLCAPLKSPGQGFAQLQDAIHTDCDGAGIPQSHATYRPLWKPQVRCLRRKLP